MFSSDLTCRDFMICQNCITCVRISWFVRISWLVRIAHDVREFHDLWEFHAFREFHDSWEFHDFLTRESCTMCENSMMSCVVRIPWLVRISRFVKSHDLWEFHDSWELHNLWGFELRVQGLELRVQGLFQPRRTGTGWRRLIESPKLQIIFHKRATKYRSLLRKMTSEDKGSYEFSPPCRRIQNSDRYQIYCTHWQCRWLFENVVCLPWDSAAGRSLLDCYRVAMISRLLAIIGLFCRI